MNFRLAPLAAAIATLSGHALAADVTLDPVAVTGSRIEQRSFDLPAAIDVVTRERIGADQPRVNASEALASVPGITALNRQNYAQDLQLSSRGFGARAAFGVRGIRPIADGIPASMPDGQGQAATFNLDRAERIEVLRGPLSSVYGNHAGGVIQLFTEEGHGRPVVEGNFSAGSDATWKADMSAKGEAGGVGYVIDTSRFVTDGYRQNSHAERDQSQVKLTFQPSQDGKLNVIASTFRQEAQDPLGQTWSGYRADQRSVAQAALDYNTRKTIEQTQGGLTYEHRFGEHSVQLSAYVGQRSTTQYQSIPKSVQGNVKHSGGVIDFDRDYGGASARWIGRFDLAGGRLTTTLGTDYETARDDRRGYENYVGNTLGVQGTLRRNELDTVTSFDQYAQAEWARGDWQFNGGLRRSHVSFKVDDRYLSNGNDGGRVEYNKTTPTVGALYRLTPAVNVYASAARGFEAPSFGELFYSGPGGTFSYSLKPAQSTHLETGLKAYVGADSRMDLALFQIDTRDELVVDSSSGGRTSYRNAGRTQRRGLELGLDSRWQGGLSSRLAYTYLDARYDEAFTTSGGTVVSAGKRLPGIAEHNLYADLTWRHAPSGFYAGVEGLVRGRMQVEDTNTQQAAPGYAIANLRVGVERSYGRLTMRTYARLNNVFDRQYVGSVVVGDSNGRYYEAAPGRNWLAGVSLRYAF